MTDPSTTDRRIPAGGAILGYCQLAFIKAAAEGMPRPQASTAGWQLLRRLVKATTGYLLPEPGESVGGVVNVPTNCLAAMSYGLHETLRKGWDGGREGPFGDVPVVLAEQTVLDLAALIDTVYRVSNGVDVLAAARQAQDYAAGKPRQRRTPADAEWLTGHISDVQAVIWQALIDQDCFSGALPAEPPAIEGR